MNILLWIILGAAAGWIAGRCRRLSGKDRITGFGGGHRGERLASTQTPDHQS